MIGHFSTNFRLAGPEIIESPLIPLETYMHAIPMVSFRHSANHREWKRLVRERRKLAKPKTRRNAIVMGDKIFMHPDDVRALRESMAADIDQRMTDMITHGFSAVQTTFWAGSLRERHVGHGAIFRLDGVS